MSSTRRMTYDLSHKNPWDGQDTSYSNGSVIAFPPATARLQFPQPAEMTPPPSPPQASPESASSPFKFGPGGFLSRAGSVIGRRPQQQSSTSSSPTRSAVSNNDSTTSLNTQQQRRRKGTKSTAFADFFAGSSELVSSFTVGSAPVRRNDTGSSTSVSPTRPNHTRQNSALTSAANLFTKAPGGCRAASPAKMRQSAPGIPHEYDDTIRENDEMDAAETEADDDEIENLDLEDELFRGITLAAAVEGGDGIAAGPGPEAFDTLFANAERLFMRMQIAHQGQRTALRGVRAQLREEREEASMRAEHLRTQLDDMGARVGEQDEEFQRVVAELQRERTLRMEERERRVRSVRVVGGGPGEQLDSTTAAGVGNDYERSVGTPWRGRTEHRQSFESYGAGSESASASAAGSHCVVWSRDASVSGAESISTMPDEVDVGGSFATGAFGAGLREENIRLKARIAELEETVDGCLGLVHGL